MRRFRNHLLRIAPATGRSLAHSLHALAMMAVAATNAIIAVIFAARFATGSYNVRHEALVSVAPLWVWALFAAASSVLLWRAIASTVLYRIGAPRRTWWACVVGIAHATALSVAYTQSLGPTTALASYPVDAIVLAVVLITRAEVPRSSTRR